MIVGGNGPVVVLSAEDARLIERAVLEELARRTARDGTAPSRLREIASELSRAAQRARNSRRSLAQVTRLRGTGGTGEVAGSGTVSVAEAAEVLGISQSLIRRRLRLDQLQGSKDVTGCWRVDTAALAAFAERSTAA